VANLCHVLVKILLPSGKAAVAAGNDSPTSDATNELRYLVNAAFLDYLDAALSISSSSTSIGNNAKFEHFSLFESFISRFQLEVVDEGVLQRLEDLVFRKELTTFSRKHLVSIFNQVLGCICRKEGAEGGENKLKDIFGRNLKKCLDAVVEEIGKKETTGMDTSSIISYLSIVLQMHKTKGKFVASLLTDDHRDSFRHLVAGINSSSPSSNAGNRIAIDNLRRIGMYWGMTKDVRRIGGGGGGGKNKNKNKNSKNEASDVVVEGAVTSDVAVPPTSDRESLSMDTEMDGKENQVKVDVAAKEGGGGGKGRKRKRQ